MAAQHVPILHSACTETRMGYALTCNLGTNARRGRKDRKILRKETLHTMSYEKSTKKTPNDPKRMAKSLARKWITIISIQQLIKVFLHPSTS